MSKTQDLPPAKSSLTVDAKKTGERIDKFLAAHYQSEKSRAYFQWLIEKGAVQVNEKTVKKQHKLAELDRIDIIFDEIPSIELVPESVPFSILYEDEAILVIDKPAGLVVHPAPGNWRGTFANGLLYHCHELENRESLRPGIVHRLDKETSGVLIAAKTVSAHQHLTAQFAARCVKKEYLAICLGNPGKGEVDQAIARHPVERKKMRVVQEGGRQALTYYQTLHYNEKLSLVQLEPHTGRTHQIRVHMHYRGTPVIGDKDYGSLQVNKKYMAERHMLHAHKLRLRHPISNLDTEFVAPLPSDMRTFLEKESLR